MEFKILGPVEVHGDEGKVGVGGARLRTLLAMLLVNRNQVVSDDRLMDELWAETPPASGRAALHTRVSALRRLLASGDQRPGGDRIERQTPGYSLRVDVDELDADRFEHLVDEGRRQIESDPAAGAAALAAGLQLWRGEPLADVAFATFAQPEIQRLSELRRRAIEDHVEARLRLGRHPELIHELGALVVRYPFRERLHEQRMLALYRSGRQADALAAFQDARRALADELGIEPGPALQHLQQAVLAQDPMLLAPTSAEEPTAARDGAKPVTAAEHRRVVSVVGVMVSDEDSPDPELARRQREHLATIVGTIVERHGGHLDGFVDDRVLAVFGVPDVHEDDALRAVRAARDVARATSVPVRIAIETGEILAGGPSSGVGGQLVTRSERMLRVAEPGQIVVGSATERLVRSTVRLDPRPETLETGATWVVRDVMDLAGRPLRSTPDSALIGREHELGQLLEAFARARRDRSVHLVTVIGPPGVGKSRLAREFASTVGPDATVLTGHCLSYGEGITFWPIAEMLSQVTPDGRLGPLLAGDGDAELIEARLGALLGSTGAGSSVQEAFWAVRRFIESIARQRPAIVIVEDIHWAEPSLLALLEYLAGWTRDAAVVLLCLARPELLEARPGWGGGKLNSATIILGSLTGTESTALVDALPGSDGLSPAVRSRIEEIAEGNPLFLEQIVAYSSESSASDKGVAIPPTIRALLTARLERLGPSERGALECAAIVGLEFTIAAVLALLPAHARPSATAHLETLEAKEFVRSMTSRRGSDAAFRFRHVLLQQSVYRAMTKELRGELHERFADWLESSSGRSPLEIDEVVGYHLEQAVRNRRDIGDDSDLALQLARRAATHLLAAGRRAFTAGDMPAAASLLRRATDLLPPADGDRLDSLPDLAVALFETGSLDGSLLVVSETLELGRSVGDERAIWRATVQAGHIGLYLAPEHADVDRLTAEAREATRVLGRLGDRRGSARAWRGLSDLLLLRGRINEAGRASMRAAQDAEAAASGRERAWALGQAAFCWVWGPTRVHVAVRRLSRLVESAGGDLLVEANALGFLAVAEMMAGRVEDARTHMARGGALTRDLGLTWQAGYHDSLAAEVERLAGNPAGAEALARSSVETMLRLGDKWTAAIGLLDHVRVLLELGRTQDALARIDEVDALPIPQDLEWQIKRNELAGRAFARVGRIDEALVLADQAVAVACNTEWAELHANTLWGLAEVQAAAGHVKEAGSSFAEAIARFATKGDRSSVSLAQAARAELLGSESTSRPLLPGRG